MGTGLLLPLMGFSGTAGAAPAPAAAVQETPPGTVTVLLRDVVLTGVAISAGTDDDSAPGGGDAPVVRLDVASLSEVAELRVDRPLADGSLRIGADGQPTITAAAAPGGITLHATYACLRGLGLTRLGLLRGILDAPLNQALDVDPAVGFQPTWATELANVIGSTDVEIVIEELRADVGQLDGAELTLAGATLVRDAEPVVTAAAVGCGQDLRRVAPADAAAVTARLDAAMTEVDAGPAPAPSVRRQPLQDGVLGGFGEHLPDRHENRRPHVAQ